MFREEAGTFGDVEDFPSASSFAPATPSDIRTVSFKKHDEKEQLVFGEVYSPGFPDSQGDFMTEETIKKMAYDFMKRGLVTRIDLHHTKEESGCYIVESFIARPGDPDFIPGSWVIGVKCTDEVWRMVESGELNGFSFDGRGYRVDAILELEMPEVLEGETDEANGHKHRFTVKFDEKGNFLGGWTDVGPDGSRHRILRGTVTEKDLDHEHRFSFVEVILDAQGTY